MGPNPHPSTSHTLHSIWGKAGAHAAVGGGCNDGTPPPWVKLLLPLLLPQELAVVAAVVGAAERGGESTLSNRPPWVRLLLPLLLALAVAAAEGVAARGGKSTLSSSSPISIFQVGRGLCLGAGPKPSCMYSRTGPFSLCTYR